MKPTAQQWIGGALAFMSGVCGTLLALFGEGLDPATHKLLLSAGSACALAASSLFLKPTAAPAPQLSAKETEKDPSQ